MITNSVNKLYQKRATKFKHDFNLSFFSDQTYLVRTICRVMRSVRPHPTSRKRTRSMIRYLTLPGSLWHSVCVCMCNYRQNSFPDSAWSFGDKKTTKIIELKISLVLLSF